MSADFPFRLAKMHVVAALAQHPCAFQPSRAGADDEDAARLGGRLDNLRMPAAPEFLVSCGVLSAHQRCAAFPARAADIAADTFADVLKAPLFDFLGQEGIGDGRTCRADDIGLP